MSRKGNSSRTALRRRNWATYLSAKMRELGVSPSDLVERINAAGGPTIDASRVSNWRSGKNCATYINARSVARALGLPEEEVLAAAGYGPSGELLDEPDSVPGLPDPGEISGRLDDICGHLAEIATTLEAWRTGLVRERI